MALPLVSDELRLSRISRKLRDKDHIYTMKTIIKNEKIFDAVKMMCEIRGQISVET